MAVSDATKFNVTTNIQHCCEFEWCIDSLSFAYGNLRSRTFRITEDCPVEWTIVLELGNPYVTDKMKIMFEILHKKTKDLKGKFSYKFSFTNGTVLKSDFVENIFPYINKNRGIELPRLYYDEYHGWKIHGNFVDRNNHIKFQGNMTITNCCQRVPKNVTVPNKYLPQLQIDFKSLLKSQQFTDVTLNVGNEVIRAHKFVLCARSPVFQKMFEQNFKEAVNNSVDVKDMEKSVLENFLEFLYSGVMENRNFKTITALYSAADKYEVKTLQDLCREILISCLSESTAPEILKLADMHNDNNLKETAIVFICDNFVKVELTAEWSQLLDTDPRLSSYTLRRVSAKITKS